MYCDVLCDILASDDLLIQYRCRTPLELVVPQLLLPDIGRDVVPQQRRLLLCDDRDIDVASRSQIVEDTRENRIRGELHCVVARQIRLPLRLENAHRRQGSGTHRHVWQLIRATVRVDGEEMCAYWVTPCHHEVRTDVPLVPEEVLLQHGHAGSHAGLAAGGERVEFEI